MRKLSHKGFTLIEVIVVMVMLSIMVLAAGYYMGNRGEKAQLKSAARDLASNMNLARIRAIRDTRPWAIEFDSNGYRVISDSGEPFAPEDPLDPIDWDDPDETTFRTVTLPGKVSFGSSQNAIGGGPVTDEITFANDRIIFNPNGTCSGSGEAYLTVASGATFAVSSIGATGLTKIQNNNGSGWSH